MQGSPAPANNLWFATSIVTLWAVFVKVIEANNWLVLPDGFLGETSTPIFALTAHFWDYWSGDNKPKESPPPSSIKEG